jgi:rubrerythrin
VVDPKLTILEAVALAVRSEIESTELYAELADRVRNPEVKKLMRALAADEEKHRESLMALHEKLLAGKEPSIPRQDGRATTMELPSEPDYLAVVTAARDKEKISEAFYKAAADQVDDEKARMFFLEVAEAERVHAARLQRLVDKLEEDPRWPEREQAGSGKGMHTGP